MQKQNEFANTMPVAPPDQFPPAPPSYEDSQKQPAFNPYVQPGASHPMPTMASPTPPPPQVMYVTVPAAAPPQPVAVGPKSANLICPNCKAQVKTVTSTEFQKAAHICAVICCLCICWLCCWVPYCMKSFKNVHHKCPSCGAFIGTYKG